MIDYSNVDFTMMGIVLAFIVFDVIAGLIKAVYKNEFSSTKMREGLMHKTGTMLIMLVCMVCDIATATSSVDLALPIGVVDIFGALVVVMELSSILENCIAMNPDLKKLGIFKIFGIDETPQE